MAQQSEVLARRFVEGFLNTGDPSVLETLTIRGYVDHDLPSGITPRESIGMFRSGFPDARFKVQDVIAAGDRVAVRYSIEATHGGEFFGVPASGRHVRLEGISIYRVEVDRLAEAWVQYDQAGLMRQITG